MFNTPLTVIGNVADRPSRRRLQPSGVSLTNLTVMSSSRHLDRETGTWSDGDVLAVRVSCWRDLADRVFESVSRGDPVIVHGWFKGKGYTDATGAKRYSYDLEAKALGHNLSFGFASFEKAGKGSGGQGPGVPELDRIVLTGMARDDGGGGLSDARAAVLGGPERSGAEREEVCEGAPVS